MAETSGSVHDSAVAKGEAPDTDAVLQQTESFTHGTSEQRMEWFRRGFDSGDVLRCSMPRR